MAENVKTVPMSPKAKSALFVIFTSVFLDLVGFGIIIPLLPLYGQDLGANEWSLPVLVAAYSLAQFFFAPLWGQISDRHGRRRVMLISMSGSTLSYLGFAVATYCHSLPLLLATRFLQGAFAANISAAQACVADVTPPEKRAGGMALIGISFGLGFILGPIIGGVSLNYLGVLAPGLVASALCGLNLVAAWFRLPETLAPEIQASNRALPMRHYDPLNTASLRKAWKHPYLWLLLGISFLQLTAFSNMEQVFALFFKDHLHFTLQQAGLKTGYALAFIGAVAAAMQGGFTRRLAPRIGERRMLIAGVFLFAVTLFFVPFGPTYASYFIILTPLAIGRSLIDPSLSSLISQAASAQEQGRTFGTFQGLNSLARVVGPAAGLVLYAHDIRLPFFLGGALSAIVFGMSYYLLSKTKTMPGVDALQPRV